MEEQKDKREFLKGALFGALIAGIVFMGIILVRYGTFGSGGAEGIAVLTSDETRTKLREAQSIIEDQFLFEADGDTLTQYLFSGIAAGLEDPYAQYYSKEALDVFMQSNEGEYYGIGIVFTREKDDDYPVIISVYPGSPAEENGLMEEDVLLMVGETDVKGMDVSHVASLVDAFREEKKKEEAKVPLRVRRGEEELALMIPFDTIQMAPVTWEMAEDGIALMKIPEFDTVTLTQFEDALEEIAEAGARKLILDVRGNPGGLLGTVTDMLDDLLEECVLVTTKTKTGSGQEIRAKDGTLFEGQLVVLTDGDSASAAEVFAGTLQYYGAAKVLGTITFGKGVVQRTYPFSDGSALKLTTEKYYIAGERDIDGIGIVPDVEEADPEEQVARAILLLREETQDVA